MPAQKRYQRSGSDHCRSGRCRIIAGDWRGRIIRFDDAEGLRPTTDRIRETVFNWLNPYITGSHCLDCFAGSGVLGLEALSRGADEVVFVESNRRTLDNLKQNLELLQGGESSAAAHRARLHHEDALDFLRALSREKDASSSSGPVESDQAKISQGGFDLVFLDPPFHKNLLSQSCSLLDSSGCLAEDAIIYIEHAIDEEIELPASWECVKQKVAGQVAYKLYIINQDP